jgi:tRNA threonylcarbamoyladenosine biosynthesis protein TsaE
MVVHLTDAAKETEKIGERLGQQLPSRILALIGELGSGKTTFVKGFARGLGIRKRIISPSFVLIRRYEITKGNQSLTINHQSFLCHIDLYRLESLSDIGGLGLEEIWNNPYNIVIVEWAEKIKKILPKQRTEINFEYLSKNKRKITISDD